MLQNCNTMASHLKTFCWHRSALNVFLCPCAVFRVTRIPGTGREVGYASRGMEAEAVVQVLVLSPHRLSRLSNLVSRFQYFLPRPCTLSHLCRIYPLGSTQGVRPPPTPSFLHGGDVRVDGTGPIGSKKLAHRAGPAAPTELLRVRELEALFWICLRSGKQVRSRTRWWNIAG